MSAVLSAVDEDYGLDRQLAQLRVPPHSAEAESSVLGGLLLDNSSWDRVSDLLTESDFYRFGAPPGVWRHRSTGEFGKTCRCDHGV